MAADDEAVGERCRGPGDAPGRHGEADAMPDAPQERLVEAADIVFTATVHADELRFRRVPATEVSFTGEPGERSTSGSTRRNLPDDVTGGVTYRDVEVRYVLAAKLLAAATPSARERLTGRPDPGPCE